MEYLDRFKRMNSLRGTNNKDYYTNIGKNNFEKYLSTIPNTAEFTINKDITTYTGAIQSFSKDGEKGDGKLLLVSLDNELKVGDYVFLKNSSDFVYQTWLVMGLESEVLHSHRKFLIKPTNYNLKFVSDGKVYQTPAIVINAMTYTLGTNTDHYTMYGDSKLNIICGRNSETELIKNDMRIICDRKVWKITNINGVSANKVANVGLLDFMASENQFNNEVDDTENEVADLYSNSNPKPNYTFSLPSELTINLNDVLTLDSTLFKVFNNGVQVVSSSCLSIETTSNLFTNNSGILTATTLGETDVNIKFTGIDKDYLIPLHVKIITPIVITSTTYQVNYSGTVTFNTRQYQTCNLYINRLDNDNIVNGVNYDISIDYNSNASSLVTFKVTDINKCSIKNNSGMNGQVVYINFKDLDTNIVTTQAITLIK